MPAITLGTSVYDTISAVGEHDLWTVTLVAGQTYEFRLHGVGFNELVDPQLFLRNPSNVQVATNDDAGSATWGGQNSVDSRIVYTAAVTGTYTIDAGEFGNNATGSYLLTAVQQTPGGMNFTLDEIAWQLVTNGSNHFGDPAAAFNVGGDNSLTINITGLTAQGQFLARQAVLAWTNVTGIVFVETAGAAELTFDDNAAGAFANTAVTGNTITSATVNIGTDWLTQFGTGLASYSFETYIHEIGHALGLGHGGNYNGSATFGIDNFYLNDALAYSVMSYMQAANDEFTGPNTFVPASFRYMFTPAIADMVAIQYLYGLRGPFINGGNTVYGYGSNTGNQAVDGAVNFGASMFFAVFDEGGSDTFNFSAYAGSQQIDLRSEAFSNVLGGSMNVSIGRNVIIENAIGGSGVDVIYGNDVTNYVYGGNGNDVLVGNGGADQIAGESGADYILGGDAGDAISGGIGNDSISGDGGDDYVLGEANNDAIAGGAGGDVIDGGDGDDTLWGHDPSGAGDLADLINGNNGNDVIVGHDGSDQLYGGSGQDTISGGNGGDAIYGQAGNDNLYGLAGGDAFIYDAINFGADNIWDFTPGQDKIFMTTAVFSNFAEVQASAVAGAGFIVITDAGGLGQIALQGFGLAALNSNDWVFF